MAALQCVKTAVFTMLATHTLTKVDREQADLPRLKGATAYFFSLVCIWVALATRLALDPLWGDKVPFVLFVIAAFVVSQFSGTGPTIVVIMAGFLLADWFFVAPRHSFLISGTANWVNSAFFFLINFLVLFLSRRARQALGRERTLRLRLQQHVEALRVSEARSSSLAAIVESSDDAIIGKSLDGTIVTWNAAAEKLYGYAAAEAIGSSVAMLLPPDRVDELAPLLERIRRGEKISHFETTRRARNGRLVEVSLSISPVRDASGKIAGASAIARDISERVAVERQRDRLLGELRAALAQVKTLSGLLPICSHCKKIRDDRGDWNQIEHFIRERSNANFTHSICPECALRLYPQLYKDAKPATKGPL